MGGISRIENFIDIEKKNGKVDAAASHPFLSADNHTF